MIQAPAREEGDWNTLLHLWLIQVSIWSGKPDHGSLQKKLDNSVSK